MTEPLGGAPDFELPDQDGRRVRLSDFRGQLVVVYFYPNADARGKHVPSRLGRLARPSLDASLAGITVAVALAFAVNAGV